MIDTESRENSSMELTAHDCPRRLKRELKTLFPNTPWHEMDITVLNIAQRSKTDQAAWSNEMEEERNILTGQFIKAAQAVSITLARGNYWADFIDPSSGRPYIGSYTNATLFETDDSYKQMGFEVEDLGCCKVLKHSLWSSNVFVGTIFTNASKDNEVILEIQERINKKSQK